MNAVSRAAIVSFAMISICCMADTTMPTYRYTWDFSKSHDTSLVNWPQNPNPLDIFLDLDVHDRVLLKFDNNRVFDNYVDRLAFCKDGDRLLYIKLFLEPQKLEDAFQAANAFAETWDIPKERIRAWHEAAVSGMLQRCLAANHRSRPAIDLELSKSLDEQKPVTITVTIGWPKSVSTTEPSGSRAN